MNKAEQLLEKFIEPNMQFMAKIYTTNSMISTTLTLLFEQQQKGEPLTDEEISTIRQAHIKRLRKLEKSSIEGLRQYLEGQ